MESIKNLNTDTVQMLKWYCNETTYGNWNVWWTLLLLHLVAMPASWAYVRRFFYLCNDDTDVVTEW